MNGKITHSRIMKRLGEIAFGKTNDIAKLAFMDADSVFGLDTLDLTLLSEIKRGTNGTVEVKTLDRLEAIELLLRELNSGEGAAVSAASFFEAMDKAAAGGAGEAD